MPTAINRGNEKMGQQMEDWNQHEEPIAIGRRTRKHRPTRRLIVGNDNLNRLKT